jgi:hypothetical protein
MADQKKHDAGAESGEDFEKPKDGKTQTFILRIHVLYVNLQA